MEVTQLESIRIEKAMKSRKLKPRESDLRDQVNVKKIIEGHPKLFASLFLKS